MSYPGSPGHLRCPALSVIIPVDGGLRARRGRASAALTTALTTVLTAEDVDRAICSVLDQSVRDLEVLAVVEAPRGRDAVDASASPVSALRRLSVRDRRVRLMPAADTAAAVRAARSSSLIGTVSASGPNRIFTPRRYIRS